MPGVVKVKYTVAAQNGSAKQPRCFCKYERSSSPFACKRSGKSSESQAMPRTCAAGTVWDLHEVVRM